MTGPSAMVAVGLLFALAACGDGNASGQGGLSASEERLLEAAAAAIDANAVEVADVEGAEPDE